MNLFNFFYFLPIIAILILGYFLRVDNLNTWPRKGATFDEYAWAWQGINLIQKRVPISWSPHPQYKNAKSIIYQETHFRIVKPYLEHPPVFGLLAGSFALLNGVKGMYDLNLPDIRGLALLLGVLSIFILYIFLAEIYDKRIALLGSLLYAAVPSVVVSSRLVQNENFFIPFWLLSLFLTSKYIRSKKTIFRNTAAILCGVLVLAKIPWAAAALSSVLIFVFLRRYKDAFKFLLVFVPIASLYFVYGIYFDKDLFISLWGLQLNRYDISFNSIFALFQKPFLADRFYTDGWIYFGWFSLLLLFIKDIKKHLFIIIPVLSYFLVFLAAIPDEAGHGWYRYPFFPFLITSIALFIKEYFNKNHILSFIFIVFVATSLLQLTWANVFGFSYFIFRISILTWVLTLLPLFFENKKVQKIGKSTSWIWFIALILMSIWAVFLYNEQ